MSQSLVSRNTDAPRPLAEPVPGFLETRLRQDGFGPADVALAARSDIDLEGEDRGQWIAVAGSNVYVASEGDAPDEIRVFRLHEVSAFRALAGVGSGLLEARIGDVWIDLVRYSNRHAFAFETLARALERALRGEPLGLLAGEDVDPRRCPRCGLMLDASGDSCPQCVPRGRVLRRIVALFAPYRAAAIVMMVLLVGGIALDLVSPLLTRFLVDDVIPGSVERARALQRSPALMGESVRMLLAVVLVLAIVQIVRQLVSGVTGVLAARVGTAITHDVRGRLVRHLQQLSIGFYDRQQVGALMGRVAYDTENLHDFVSQVTGGFLLQLLLVVGVGLTMFGLDARLALYTLLPAPFVIAGTVFFWRYIYPRYYRVTDSASKQAGMLTGLLSGIRVVKAFNQEERQQRRFEALSGRVQRARRDVDGAIATFNPLMGIVFQFGGWIVWYVGGREVLEQRLTLGELMAFFGYLWMFYGPLGTLPQFTNWLTQFVAQAHRMFEILDTPGQVPEPADPVHVQPLAGAVELDHVAFGYDRHTPVLKDLSLRIAPGELVGLVGQSGSGKTTIINLVCRLYDVDSGSVRIDGVDVRRIPNDELRRGIGVALQEAFLFRGSIWQNLAFGRPDAPDEDVLRAARAADCHEFVMRQPHAYDTWVGESGAGLSGGERQRVGIARVLLMDPRILILDESTSSVDTRTEQSIQRALAEVMRGRTTIAIAHRLSTLRGADRIFVLDGGRIVEQGPPAELLERGGRFAQMVRSRHGEPGGAARARFETRASDRPAPRPVEAPPPDETLPSGLPPTWSHHPRWLDPRHVTIDAGERGELVVTIPGEPPYRGVFARWCFPVRHPAAFVSLRAHGADDHEFEVGLVRDLAPWPGDARARIEGSLRRRYFVQAIRAIHAIRLAGSHLEFDVETDAGPQRFMMRWQQERAQDYGPRGKLLLDTEENRYLIADVERLAPRDRRLFRRFVYW